jgi:alkyl hydroperoxide reductase subunit F
MIYDVAIIGGGPAAVSAGVYAARKRLKTLFITKEFGGQSNVSEDIQNWIGTPSVSGGNFTKMLKAHLESYKGDFLTIQENEWVSGISKTDKIFTIISDKGSYQAKTILVAVGSTRRKLEVPGAAEFDNKGLTYCASCDGPLFADMDVAVVGGGNAAFETAAQLLAYCKSVTLLSRSDFRADKITVDKLLQNPKLTAVANTEIVKVSGEKFVTGISYKIAGNDEVIDLPTKGIFVEIGLIPGTSFLKDTVALEKYGHIITDPRTQRTSVEGIWAAGDATDGLYHQNNIAAGDAVKALEDLYLYLHIES